MTKPQPSPASRSVRLFRSGPDQAVRIPAEFELPGEEALMRRDGERLIIEPAVTRSGLLAYLESLEPIDDDFPEIEDPPPEPVDLFD